MAYHNYKKILLCILSLDISIKNALKYNLKCLFSNLEEFTNMSSIPLKTWIKYKRGKHYENLFVMMKRLYSQFSITFETVYSKKHKISINLTLLKMKMICYLILFSNDIDILFLDIKFQTYSWDEIAFKNEALIHP